MMVYDSQPGPESLIARPREEALVVGKEKCARTLWLHPFNGFSDADGRVLARSPALSAVRMRGWWYGGIAWTVSMSAMAARRRSR